MKYFVKIISDVVIQIYRSNIKLSEADYEITEEQFNTINLPCRVIISDNSIEFGDIVPWDKVPDVSEHFASIPTPTTEEQIAALKTQLSSTDYKIIKCSEASLVGEELPYDIVTLHAERQAIRDQINELENLIK